MHDDPALNYQSIDWPLFCYGPPLHATSGLRVLRHMLSIRYDHIESALFIPSPQDKPGRMQLMHYCRPATRWGNAIKNLSISYQPAVNML